MTNADLHPNEYDEYYGRYIFKLNPNIHLRKSFQVGLIEVVSFFNEIPSEKENFAYSGSKWSIKEVLQHLIDTERIFSYRFFRIARGDETPLAGFDQNIYNRLSGAVSKKMEVLVEEYRKVREASISLLNSLSDEGLARVGSSNGSAISARAAAFVLPGHEIWHIEIIKERYLR